MIALFFGPPGSGKGTQAQILRDRLGVPHLSTGDMFRAAILGKTELGQRVEGLLKRGELVPDELTLKMLLERVSQPDCRQGFILDGFPRNLNQAADLKSALKAQYQSVGVAVLFDISHDDVVRRLSSRRTCGSCGHVLSTLIDSACPKCGSSDLLIRPDDKPEVVRNRLDVYDRQTAPLVEYYRSEGLLRRVDASRTQAAVTGDLLGILRG